MTIFIDLSLFFSQNDRTDGKVTVYRLTTISNSDDQIVTKQSSLPIESTSLRNGGLTGLQNLGNTVNHFDIFLRLNKRKSFSVL